MGARNGILPANGAEWPTGGLCIEPATLPHQGGGIPVQSGLMGHSALSEVRRCKLAMAAHLKARSRHVNIGK